MSERLFFLFSRLILSGYFLILSFYFILVLILFLFFVFFHFILFFFLFSLLLISRSSFIQVIFVRGSYFTILPQLSFLLLLLGFVGQICLHFIHRATVVCQENASRWLASCSKEEGGRNKSKKKERKRKNREEYLMSWHFFRLTAPSEL